MTLEQYETIINAYLDFYPDDKVDVQIRSKALQQAIDNKVSGKETDAETLDCIENERYALSIITYYPSLTLTNDSGKQYTVYDIYVQTLFPEFEISMGRTTYNTEEVKVGYRHSHILSGSFREMSSFCTGGSDTPINKIRSRVRRERFENFETLVQSFIIEVERMIRIESNAGGPYITFDSVGKNSIRKPLHVSIDDSVLYTCSSKTRELILKFIDYYCGLFLDDFYYDGRNWQLSATDAEFIKRVTKVAKAWRKTANAHIYYKVNIIHGLYYLPADSGHYTVNNGDLVNWHFKGKFPTIKVVSSGNDNVKNDTIVSMEYISAVYSFMLNLINGVYANQDRYKDSIHSRAYKIKTELIKAM